MRPPAPPPSERNHQGFREEFLEGLRRKPKTLPCKYFYDERGSRLFEQICGLEEYYLTRTELGILAENRAEISQKAGAGARLVELGSGSSRKTRLLLDALEAPSVYVPVDIAEAQLFEASQGIASLYPELEVLAVCADYSREFQIPESRNSFDRTVIFFPGSTIGNLTPEEARRFLHQLAPLCGGGGGLLIGVDLRKERTALERAYNDRAGVTAAFNLNILVRAQRELGVRLRLDRFRHSASFNRTESRIEMRLVSLEAQVIRLGAEEVILAKDEAILTEYSYKYSVAEFQELARQAGFVPEKVWLDRRHRFSVHYLAG